MLLNDVGVNWYIKIIIENIPPLRWGETEKKSTRERG